MLFFCCAPAVLVASLYLYRLLAGWLTRRDAGTYATFLAFGTLSCLFVFVFLPFEFPWVRNFFGVLLVASAPVIFVIKRKKEAEPAQPLGEALGDWKTLFNKGDSEL